MKKSEWVLLIIIVMMATLTFLVYIPQIWVLGIVFGAISVFASLNRLKQSANKVLPIISLLIAVVAALSFVFFR